MPEQPPSPPVGNTSPSREEVTLFICENVLADFFEVTDMEPHDWDDLNQKVFNAVALLPQPSEDLARELAIETTWRAIVAEAKAELARVTEERDALKAELADCRGPGPMIHVGTARWKQYVDRAETAEASLSRLQAGQEPVAWRVKDWWPKDEPWSSKPWSYSGEPPTSDEEGCLVQALYASPQHPQVQAGEVDLEGLAAELDQMATDRQEWADDPEIGGAKPRFYDHLRGKRYGYSHAAQLIRSRLKDALARQSRTTEGGDV